MAPNLFRIMLAIVALYAFLRGRRDERIVSGIIVIGVIATHLVISPVQNRFAGVESAVMTVDLLVFVGFLWVALVSERFWPLWIAGLLITPIIGPVLMLLDTTLFPRAYGAALVFWSYPIVLILAVGTWRSERRLKRSDI